MRSYIVKVDRNGSFQWEKSIRYRYSDFAQCIIQTDEGAYTLVGGIGYRSPKGSDIFLTKFMEKDKQINTSSIDAIDFIPVIIAISIYRCYRKRTLCPGKR
ncbi:MAG: hypothetical protein ACFFFH_08865 [Candidatus Thorarchaeota archaeon]